MDVELVADAWGCGDGKPCPKIWRTEDGRYWLQGERPPTELLARVDPPDHEFLVEYHRDLIGWKPAED
jgi:hypothetical protein